MFEFLDHCFWVVISVLFGAGIAAMVCTYIKVWFPALIATAIYLCVPLPQWGKIVLAVVAFGWQGMWAQHLQRVSKVKGEEIPIGFFGVIGGVLGAIVGLLLGIVNQPPVWASGWFDFLAGGGAFVVVLILLFSRFRKPSASGREELRPPRS
jgi:hypothetical protein